MPVARIEIDRHYYERWSMDDFVKLLNTYVAQTPPEVRDTIWVTLEDGEYGSATALVFTREQTPAEIEAARVSREEHDRKAKQDAADRERREFERLKAKFEGPQK